MAAFLQSCGKGLDGIAKGDGWNHGPFGCYGDCEDLSSVPCATCVPGSAVQYGITAKAMGYNFLICCCYAQCCPCCAACQQRAEVAKKHAKPNLVMDVALACCCPACAILQNANQVGKQAAYSNWKLSDLLAPPTPEEIEKAKNSTKDAAKSAADSAKA